MFDLFSRAGAEMLVSDTSFSRARSSVFEVSSLYDQQAVMEYPLVLIPSRQAVLELADQFGYETAALAQNMTDYTGLADYRDQRRLAFLCSRSQPLHGRVIESRPPFAPWWVAALKNSRKGARSTG